MSSSLPKLKSFTNSIRTGWVRMTKGAPDRKLKLIAISGTRGKTTVAQLMFTILRRAKYSVGLISTDGTWANDEELNFDFNANTLTAENFHRALKTMLSLGVTIVVVETHSQAITQGVFDGVVFDSGALTNIGGGEFAEGFKDQIQYAETLFEPITQIANEGLAVINADDDSAQWVNHRSQYIEQNIYAAWCSKSQAEELNYSFRGITFRYEGGFFQTTLIGSLNLENLLLAIKLANKYTGVDQIDRAITEFAGVSGHLEAVQLEPFTVIIDSASEPVIVEKIITDLNQIRNPEARLICVIGAPGRRQPSAKLIAQTVAKYAKTIIITPLDPGDIDVAKINTEIFQNAEKQNTVLVERIGDHDEFKATDKVNLRSKVERVIRNSDVPIVAFDDNTPVGRADGIAFAIQIAGPDDVVILFGKGNHDTMDFGKAIYEWSDHKLVEKLLEKSHRGY